MQRFKISTPQIACPFSEETKNNLRIQSQSSLNNIGGVLVLGLKSSIVTLSDCSIDLHIEKPENINQSWIRTKGFRKNRKMDMSSEKQTWVVVKMIPWSELEKGWSESEESWKGWEVIERTIVAFSKKGWIGVRDERYFGGIGRMLLVGWLCDMWEWCNSLHNLNTTKQQNRNNDGWILSYLCVLCCLSAAQRRKK